MIPRLGAAHHPLVSSLAPASSPRWLVYSLLALALWALWGLVGAAVGRAVSPLVVQVVSTAGLIPAAALLLLSPGVRAQRPVPRGLALAFVTGLSANLGSLSLLWALSLQGPVSLVMPLAAMYPLVTALLARVFLGERLGGIQRLGFGLAIAAGVIIGRVTADPAASGAAGLATWLLPALGALLCFGSTGFLQKLATRYVSNELCTVVFAMASLPLAAAILLLGGELSFALTGGQWLLAVAFGALLAVGTLAQFAAYRWGKASVVTGLTGLYPALVVVLAVPLFAEALDAGRAVAVCLAVIAALALSHEPATGR